MGQEWIFLVFIFALGSCVGSFLNVVIYRLPRDKSLVSPPSTCPGCGRRIRFYDNIPILSWFLLGGKCRCCKGPISPRYFVVELLTAAVFVLFYVWVFMLDKRRLGLGAPPGLGSFLQGGWLFYIVNIVLISGLLAASAIDIELWVIPISICWFITIVGVAAASLAGYVIKPAVIWTYSLFPSASVLGGAIATGALAGFVISMSLLWTGLLKRSYCCRDDLVPDGPDEQGRRYNDRREILREVLFLLPIILCSITVCVLLRYTSLSGWWSEFSQRPVINGFLGSLWGYIIGAGIVWATRIFGTLAFGREAMGLGDVHLMGAAGSVIGPVLVTIAFFTAPFFGLAWAGYQMLFKKMRQIPYGPFLSLGVVIVIIFHDRIRVYIGSMFIQ